MSIDAFIIIICFVSLIIGALGGIQFSKIRDRKQDKKILENAEEFLSGKRDNKIKIDGEEFDATKFIVRDKEEKEILIDFQKGGVNVQHGRQQDRVPGLKEIQEQEVKTPKETSGGSREKKRTTRARSIFSRIRRFG